MGYDYRAQCSQRNCRHLVTPLAKRERLHCDVSGCKNDMAICEQHSPKGRELLDARLKRDGRY